MTSVVQPSQQRGLWRRASLGGGGQSQAASHGPCESLVPLLPGRHRPLPVFTCGLFTSAHRYLVSMCCGVSVTRFSPASPPSQRHHVWTELRVGWLCQKNPPEHTWLSLPKGPQQPRRYVSSHRRLRGVSGSSLLLLKSGELRLSESKGQGRTWQSPRHRRNCGWRRRRGGRTQGGVGEALSISGLAARSGCHPPPAPAALLHRGPGFYKPPRATRQHVRRAAHPPGNPPSAALSRGSASEAAARSQPQPTDGRRALFA